MSEQTKTALYTYPMRGFSVITIFLGLGPVIQTIVGTYISHYWVGGDNLLVEVFSVLTQEARPRILAGYSFYMPSIFISGLLCSLAPSRGYGLTMVSSIKYTVLVNFIIECFYFLLSRPYFEHMMTNNIIEQLFYELVQWVAVGWVCWFVASGFRLDKPVSQ